MIVTLDDRIKTISANAFANAAHKLYQQDRPKAGKEENYFRELMEKPHPRFTILWDENLQQQLEALDPEEQGEIEAAVANTRESDFILIQQLYSAAEARFLELIREQQPVSSI